jgi:pyruvate kinase
MIQPVSLAVIPGEYPPKYRAWVLQGKSGRFLVIPDSRFPSRKPIRFFTNEYDASRVLETVLGLRPELAAHKLVAIEVGLSEALQAAAADGNLSHADSFVVLDPGEVYDFIAQLKKRNPS